MPARTVLMVAAALCVSFLCRTASVAQGGWDVWAVELRDGTRLEVAPVWSLDGKELRFGFGGGGAGKGTAVKRSHLRLMSNNLGNSRYRADKGLTTCHLPCRRGISARTWWCSTTAGGS